MNIIITLAAKHFLGDTPSFFGQPVRNFKPEYKADDEPPFVFIPGVGDAIKVSYGQWVITYPDGAIEIWNTKEVECFPNDLPHVLPIEQTIPPIV